MMITNFLDAFSTTDLEQFMNLLFPPSWGGIAARILETGATFDTSPSGLCSWAPRWSKIPRTLRTGSSNSATAVKSCIFRVHDCLHQLWGLPTPDDFSEEEFYVYKRSQMCGEVAVLTLTEFVFCKYWYDEAGHSEMDALEAGLFRSRNAIPMLEGPLAGRSTLEIAQRLDDLLHKKSRPRWVRDHAESLAFVEDYVPMLEFDRVNIDHNWALMKAAGRFPASNAPNARYSLTTDGLELTQWMIRDFYHLMDTGTGVDWALASFNEDRRENIVLPDGWNGANKPVESEKKS